MWRWGYAYIRFRHRALELRHSLAGSVLALTLGLCVLSAAGGEPSRAQRRELDRAEAQLHKSLMPLEAGPAVQILRDPERVVLRIPTRLLFDAESTIPRADAPARSLLMAVRQLLRQRVRLALQVEVYTDGIGGSEANLRFAQRRADALLTWLTEEGLSASRLRASARGASEPLASDDVPEGRARNRRIEFALEPAPLP
jgi:outer membrane protein OmpA-like peptidoglycan-associated protein